GWLISENDGTDNWIGLINKCMGPKDDYCDLEYTVRCCVKKVCVDGETMGELVCRVRFDMRDKWSLDDTAYGPARYTGRPFWHIVHFDKILDEKFPL
ncbi:MAG: hypothetical protein JSU94_08430, partial [Phycisphaerales bacterium]